MRAGSTVDLHQLLPRLHRCATKPDAHFPVHIILCSKPFPWPLLGAIREQPPVLPNQVSWHRSGPSMCVHSSNSRLGSFSDPQLPDQPPFLNPSQLTLPSSRSRARPAPFVHLGSSFTSQRPTPYQRRQHASSVLPPWCCGRRRFRQRCCGPREEVRVGRRRARSFANGCPSATLADYRLRVLERPSATATPSFAIAVMETRRSLVVSDDSPLIARRE